MRLLLGDCREVMPTLADASVDSVVTDPPYELGFMGKAWDASGIAGRMRHCLRPNRRAVRSWRWSLYNPVCNPVGNSVHNPESLRLDIGLG